MCMSATSVTLFFFFNDTATTEIYTLSLHDALPIWLREMGCDIAQGYYFSEPLTLTAKEVTDLLTATHHRNNPLGNSRDRKSTRLNSSHANISYAVFCLKKKKNNSSILYYSFHLILT